jgi:hypothetical protein
MAAVGMVQETSFLNENDTCVAHVIVLAKAAFPFQVRMPSQEIKN